MSHTITIEEGERQGILLALAEMSLARPGWLNLMEQIAFKMDSKDELGRPAMFEQFRYLRALPVIEALEKDALPAPRCCGKK